GREMLFADRVTAAHGEVVVAVRIVDVVPDAVRIIRSGTDAGIGRGIAVDMPRADLHAEAVRTVPVSETGAAARVAVAAVVDRDAWAVEASGEDLDHATDRVRTPVACTRTAHDLDALDRVDRQLFERERASVRRCDAHAVDEDQYLVGIGAAQEQRSLRAGAAGAVQVYTGLQAQDLEHVARGARIDVLARDDAHVGQGRVDRLHDARGGDRDLGLQVELFRGDRRGASKGHQGK